jgi:hypothetical protein
MVIAIGDEIRAKVLRMLQISYPRDKGSLKHNYLKDYIFRALLKCTQPSSSTAINH